MGLASLAGGTIGVTADRRADEQIELLTVSIGAVCSEAARAEAIEPAVEPERHRLGAMVIALAQHAASLDEREAVALGGRLAIAASPPRDYRLTA